MLVSSAYIVTLALSSISGGSFIYIKKRSDPKQDPWGAPYRILSNILYVLIDLKALFSPSKIGFEPIKFNTSYTIMRQLF